MITLQSTPMSPVGADGRPLTLSEIRKQRDRLLVRHEGLPGQNAGGRWMLPMEADIKRHAFAFYRKGQESLMAQQLQPIVGSSYSAPGWKVWKYPKHAIDTDAAPDEKEGKAKMKPHPLADQEHKVVGDKPDEVYLLHYRDADVQDQVNLLYADLSHQAVRAEIKGQTMQAYNPDDPTGLISEEYLSKIMGKDREVEESYGRSTAVHGGIPAGGGRVQGRPQVVSR